MTEWFTRVTDEADMLQEQARVIAVQNGLLTVETERRSACAHCGAGSRCATSVTAKLFAARRNRLVLANSLGARTGDQVVVGIPSELLVRASLSAYLLPLLFMLGATALGERLGLSGFLLSLLALGGLAMGFFTLGWFSHRRRGSQRYQPRLLRIVTPDYRRVEIPKLTRS